MSFNQIETSVTNIDKDDREGDERNDTRNDFITTTQSKFSFDGRIPSIVIADTNSSSTSKNSTLSNSAYNVLLILATGQFSLLFFVILLILAATLCIYSITKVRRSRERKRHVESLIQHEMTTLDGPDGTYRKMRDNGGGDRSTFEHKFRSVVEEICDDEDDDDSRRRNNKTTNNVVDDNTSSRKKLVERNNSYRKFECSYLDELNKLELP